MPARTLRGRGTDPEAYGVTIAGTEIVGALPLGALEEIMKHYVQAHDFELSQMIEYSLL